MRTHNYIQQTAFEPRRTIYGNTTSITDYLPDTPVLTHKIDPSKGSMQTTSYGYSSNRMTSLTGSEAATYGYNGRGDMTTLMENNVTFTPEYDLLHNLRAYKQGATTLASYGYDGDGQRVTKTAGGTTTVYHHDKSGKLLSETDANGNRVVDYVYVNGNMAAKVDNTGAVSYYHVDPAGTPTAITDNTGTLVWRAEYLPFGEEQLLVSTKANDKMFVGKEKDEETGLYYFGARYMQDRNARFVSVDPVGPVDEKSGKVNEYFLLNPQKFNRYAYTLNNPYKYIDRFGLSEEGTMAAYGETGGLYPRQAKAGKIYNSKTWDLESYQQLQEARSYIADIRERNNKMRSDKPEGNNPIEQRAWNDCKEAADKAETFDLSKNVKNFYIRQEGDGPQKPTKKQWGDFDPPIKSFGPFINVGGGDVPKGSKTYIDIYQGVK